MPNLLTSRRILRPFRIDQIQGMALWLDASDTATITLDGSNNVSQWSDKSGNGRHVAQATSLARPSYIAAGQNGLNLVRFDGTDDFLEQTGGLGSLNLTLIFAFKNRAVDLKMDHVVSFGSTSNTNVSGFCVGTGYGFGMGDANKWGWRSPNFDRSSGIVKDTNANVMSFTMTKSGTTYTGNQWLNGSSIITNSQFVIATTPAYDGGLIRIGRTIADAVYGNLDIYEVIAYQGELLTANRQSIEAYLKAKWGTT